MTPQPDFLRPVRGPHPLAYLSAGVALLVLAVAVDDARQAQDALAQARAAQASQTLQASEIAPIGANDTAGPAGTRDTAGGTGRADAPDTSDRRSAQAAQLALTQAIAQLDRPWPKTISAIEGGQAEGVAWLGLSVSERGQLRLEGQALDARAALSVAEVLRQRGLWREVVVARLERSAGGPTRFAITAEAQAGAW